mmetsp:Transcript_32881/g.63436  ORF Transcript_32881/g.63436 Transcript_32881/m.63436 type:complete len:250 (-) Transcript_32881:2027-2776(-)
MFPPPFFFSHHVCFPTHTLRHLENVAKLRTESLSSPVHAVSRSFRGTQEMFRRYRCADFYGANIFILYLGIVQLNPPNEGFGPCFLEGLVRVGPVGVVARVDIRRVFGVIKPLFVRQRQDCNVRFPWEACGVACILDARTCETHQGFIQSLGVRGVGQGVFEGTVDVVPMMIIRVVGFSNGSIDYFGKDFFWKSSGFFQRATVQCLCFFTGAHHPPHPARKKKKKILARFRGLAYLKSPQPGNEWMLLI